MAKIINTDTYKVQEAELITTTDGKLSWGIAVWAAPEMGRTKITGEGVGYQIVRREGGRYIYNNTMLGGYYDCLADAKKMAADAGYTLI